MAPNKMCLKTYFTSLKKYALYFPIAQLELVYTKKIPVTVTAVISTSMFLIVMGRTYTLKV